MLNILDLLMKGYSIDEARFLRQSLNIFSCYIGSPYFREQREKRELLELENGSKFSTVLRNLYKQR